MTIWRQAILKVKNLVVTGLLALTGTWVSAKTTFTLSTPDPDNAEITLAAILASRGLACGSGFSAR